MNFHDGMCFIGLVLILFAFVMIGIAASSKESDDKMEFARAYELMDIELQCVRRNSTGQCNRECDKCDLVQKDTDLIEAYQMAKFALNKLVEK